MADEAETPIDDEELPEVEQEAPEAESHEAEEEEILTFGDAPEEVQETDNAVIRHLREKLREANKRIADAGKPKDETPVDPGPRPTLEQFDYDEDRHAEALEAWAEQKLTAKTKVSQSTEAQQAEVEATRQRINEEKAALNRPDVDDAFELVRDTLTDAQQSALVQTVDHGNTAKLIYALAKNPDALTALAGEQNLARFIKQVGKLEGTLKMVKRRKAPPPDVPQRGSGKIAFTPSAAQKQLDKMEADYRGGDRTHIQKFKRENGLK